ncbi:MAG: DUF4055 domain-containing protein [Rhodobacteraceae bacterium]|nr:DUF4055 domain-containing protein [Paracoccaceae bacterium]
MTRARWDQLQAQYHLIRDCLDGEDAVKDQGQLYVPKPDGMTSANYAHYLDRACFYGAPEMTLRALVGLALRKTPVVKLPPRLEPMRLSATYENAPMDVLIEEMVREVASMGRFGILLDFPAEGASVNTTPHISTFRAETIEDFETAYVGGRKVLTRVHLASDEDWEGSAVTYELILEAGVYQFRRFVRDQHKNRVDVGENHIPLVNGQPLDFIPFIMVSHEGLRPEDVTPPFLSLCKVAISHFKNSADREHAIFLTASPTPWIAGSLSADKVPTQIGAGAVWLLPEGAEVGMLEFAGSGVAAMKEIMEEKSETMISLGARMLSSTVNRNETIDTATQRTRSELALLHGVVASVEAGLNRLLRLAAEWVGDDPDEASVTLSRDFIESSMEPKMIEQQMKLYLSGIISRATLHENLQKGEIVRADRSWEDEKDMIEEDGGDISPIIGTREV